MAVYLPIHAGVLRKMAETPNQTGKSVNVLTAH